MFLTKILKVLLLGKKFKKGKYTYEFTSVEPELEKNFDGIYYLRANGTLSNPNQAYFARKMSNDLKMILDNVRQYVGETFTVSLDFTLYGEEPLSLYIPFENLVEIQNRLNSKFKNFSFFNKSIQVDMFFDYSTRNPYTADGDTVLCNFDISISNLRYRERKIHLTSLEQEERNYVINLILELLYNTDDLLQGIDDVMYNVLEPDLQLNLSYDEDLFYNGSYKIKNFEGEKIIDFNYANYSELEQKFNLGKGDTRAFEKLFNSL